MAVPVPMRVRIHGRGGQGVVTAAELLASAAFADGRWSQAFPSFGSERAGAPLVAYCRIADSEIRTREPIAEPDAVIVQDPTLLHLPDLLAGLGPDGYLLVNTQLDPGAIGLSELAAGLRPERVRTVPATELARQFTGRPVPNAVLLGAFAALTGAVSMRAVVGAIRERFPGSTGDANVAAAEAAHDLIAGATEALAGAAAD